MNTLKHNPATFTDFQVKSSMSTGKTNNWILKQAAQFETNRFGFMAMYIIIQSCLGSVACMYILKDNGSDISLCLCAGLTMACNSVFIAQGSARLCLGMFYASIIINSILILINI